MKLIHKFAILNVVLFANLVLAAPAQAQSDKVEIKTSPKFMAAFREAVARPARSTVRINCEGTETALGVVINRSGYILTKGSDLTGKITVVLPNDGGEFEAKWVGYHEPNDLAMLKIDTKGLVPVQWSDSKVAPVGNFVASVGLGEDPVAVGVVSVASRNIPKNQDIKEPEAGGPYLGVALADVKGGAKIGSVSPGTAAAKAKLKIDDVIVAADDMKVKDSQELIQYLGKRKVNEKVVLTVQRGDEEIEITVTLGKRPASQSQVQNKMGSELSKRRNGFPTVLQTDTIIRPQDCGGPLCDLDGHVIGLNIARIGRVESYAIPSEIIRPLLSDLMSGKLPPPKMETSTGQ
jgi:serine protease Do